MMTLLPGHDQTLSWQLLHSFDALYKEDYNVVRESAWLVSAEVTVVSAILSAIALAVLRGALMPSKHQPRDSETSREEGVELLGTTAAPQYHPGSAASFLKNEDEARRAQSWCTQPALLLLGWIVYVISFVLMMMVLIYTRLGTVATLRVVELITNVPLAYGVLGEKFTRRDLVATACCVGACAVMLLLLPKDVPGHLITFPEEKFRAFLKDPSTDYGFTAYWISWSVLTFVCLNANCVVRSGVRKHVIAFTMPVLSGLFTSASVFLVQLMATLVYHGDSFPEMWGYDSAHALLAAALMSLVLAIYFTSNGVRMFECRFFVPASYTVTAILMILQGCVFFQECKDMRFHEIVCFISAAFVALGSICFIAPEHDISVVLPTPLATVAASSDSELGALLDRWPTPEELEVLTTMEEHGARGMGITGAKTSPQAREAADEDDSEISYADLRPAREPLVTSTPGRAWNQVCRLHPLVIFIILPVSLFACFRVGYVWEAFFLLTLYSVYTSWKFCVHTALFANVGRMKVEAYSRVNFERLFEKMAMHPESPEAHAPALFEDVMHFVLLTNYKEDVEIMREAILSVAACSIAQRQICMVLACEERETAAVEKAERLIHDLGGKFKHMHYTLHPPGLAGEVPGKSSNCRWAAKRVMEDYLPMYGYDIQKTIFTVMDADSEFHEEYFPALTYQFLAAPDGAERYNAIWQAPIVHYKNYYSQPSVVRLASLLTCQHELANLADVSATKLPYSTYSLSGLLAEGVDGWDPDWISEDWHMCCKCYCGTVGSLRIVPIFLPILNYTPEGDGWWDTLMARWTQAKRHALGVSELVYLMGTAPLISIDRSFSASRRIQLVWRGACLWMKMLFVHLILALAIIISPLNGMIIHYFYRNHLIADVNSFCFLVNSVFQAFGAGSFALQVFTSIRLYDTVAHRIVGYSEPGNLKWWGRRHVHFTTLLLQSIPNFFFLFALGGLAEWIAALKTAFTHKFHYEVALKPTVAVANAAATVDEPVASAKVQPA